MYYKYAHAEFFDGVPRADFQALSGNLVIYGAGFQGLLAAYLLDKQGIKVLCFGDQDEKKQGTTYYGLPVYSPEEMKQRYPNAVPIVTPFSLMPAFLFVRDDLGYSNAITPYSLFLEFDSDGFDQLKEIPDWYHPDSFDFNIDYFMRKCINLVTSYDLLNLDVSVTEVCNLHCKNCTSLMPRYHTPKAFELQDIYCDIQKIARGRKINYVCLEGGELFTWKPLPQLIHKLCDMDEIIYIHIVTNGTILPGSDLIDALQHPKAVVRISDYGPISKKDQLIPLLKENKIQYILMLQKWYELAVFHKEPLSGQPLKKVVDSCCKLGGMGNPYLMDGKLFRCAIQANMHRLGIFESDRQDYVDLRQPEGLEERIAKYIDGKQRPAIAKLCRHCNGRGFVGKEVPPAEQLAPGETIEVRFE